MIKRKWATISQLTTFLQMFSSQVIQPLVSRGVHDATIVVIHRSQWPTAEHSAVLSGVLQSLTRASLAPKRRRCCTSGDVPEVRNHHLGCCCRPAATMSSSRKEGWKVENSSKFCNYQSNLAYNESSWNAATMYLIVNKLHMWFNLNVRCNEDSEGYMVTMNK